MNTETDCFQDSNNAILDSDNMTKLDLIKPRVDQLIASANDEVIQNTYEGQWVKAVRESGRLKQCKNADCRAFYLPGLQSSPDHCGNCLKLREDDTSESGIN